MASRESGGGPILWDAATPLAEILDSLATSIEEILLGQMSVVGRNGCDDSRFQAAPETPDVNRR